MSGKHFALIAILVGLAAVYAWKFTDWFGPKVIGVEHSTRVAPRLGVSGSRTGNPAVSQDNGITFALDRNCRLTSVRVVVSRDADTNRYPHALWHLVSKKGSKVTDGFAYGFPIEGMVPAVSNSVPARLQPGTTYRLLVEAGKLKGTNDFSIPGRSTRR